jgi:hypothetical protein
MTLYFSHRNFQIWSMPATNKIPWVNTVCSKHQIKSDTVVAFLRSVHQKGSGVGALVPCWWPCGGGWPQGSALSSALIPWWFRAWRYWTVGLVEEVRHWRCALKDVPCPCPLPLSTLPVHQEVSGFAQSPWHSPLPQAHSNKTRQPRSKSSETVNLNKSSFQLFTSGIFSWQWKN